MRSFYRFLVFFISLVSVNVCKLNLTQPYDTRTADFYETQFIVCIVQQFKNCAILNLESPPSSLRYETNSFVFTKYLAISPVSPTVTGNSITYSVSPALPSGLTIDSTTGKLSGTPLESASLKTYTVTASNSGGSKSFQISITINFDPLLVPGLRFWVKAEGLPLTNGASVTSWTDLSNSGNTVIPGTAPTYYSSINTINGKPVVRFLYGSGHNLNKTSPLEVSVSDSGSIFFVARYVLAVNSNVMTIGTIGAGAREVQITSSGIIALNKSGVTTVASYSAGWATGTVHQVSILQNAATNILLKYDGVQVVNTTPGASGYSAGTLGLGTNGAEIDLAELFFINTRVSNSDVTDFECYLGRRYATISCP